MRHTMMMLVMLATSAIADLAPIPVTIDSQSRTAPGLELYQASPRPLRVYYRDGGAAANIGGYTPYLAWCETNTPASGVVTASATVVGASTGVVDFLWTAANLNTNGVFAYECGLTSNGVPVMQRRGTLTLRYAAYPSGVGLLSFSGQTTNGLVATNDAAYLASITNLDATGATVFRSGRSVTIAVPVGGISSTAYWAAYANIASNLTAEAALALTNGLGGGAGGVPYVGATGDVDLAGYRLAAAGVTVSNIHLQTNDQSTLPIGGMRWTATDGTVEARLSGDVVMQLGQELPILAHNLSGRTVSNGEVVHLTSASGNRIAVDLMAATNTAHDDVTIGLVTQPTIGNGEQGYVTVLGYVRGLDTDHLTEGAEVWVGVSPGTLTATAPTAPNVRRYVGVCVVKSATVGVVFVDARTTPMLSNLSDVAMNGKTASDVVAWNGVAWTNSDLVRAGDAAATNYTAAHTSLVGVAAHGLGNLATGAWSDVSASYAALTGAIFSGTVAGARPQATNDFVTRQFLQDELDLLSAENFYGSTQAHPVLSGVLAFSNSPPANWQQSYAALPALPTTNWVGSRATTNTYIRIPAGQYIHTVYASRTAQNVTYFSRLCTISTNGAVTNFLGAEPSLTTVESTVAQPHDSVTTVRTNMTYAEPVFLAVIRYAYRAVGGSAPTLTIYGGESYPTHLSTPSLFDQSLASAASVPAGTLVLTNNGAAGQVATWSGGTAAGNHTGYWSTAAAGGGGTNVYTSLWVESPGSSTTLTYNIQANASNALFYNVFAAAGSGVTVSQNCEGASMFGRLNTTTNYLINGRTANNDNYGSTFAGYFLAGHNVIHDSSGARIAGRMLSGERTIMDSAGAEILGRYTLGAFVQTNSQGAVIRGLASGTVTQLTSRGAQALLGVYSGTLFQNGGASLALAHGAGNMTITNDAAVLVGAGRSHGIATVTASNGFFWGDNPVLTNAPAGGSGLPSLPIAQYGSIGGPGQTNTVTFSSTNLYARFTMTNSVTFNVAAYPLTNSTMDASIEVQHDASVNQYTAFLANCKSPGAAPIVLSANTNLIDVIDLRWGGTNWYVRNFVGGLR